MPRYLAIWTDDLSMVDASHQVTAIDAADEEAAAEFFVETACTENSLDEGAHEVSVSTNGEDWTHYTVTITTTTTYTAAPA